MGQSVTFAGSVSDPDGDSVTVLWNFGDGTSSTELVPGPTVYNDVGTFTVTFIATDEHGLSDPTPDTRYPDDLRVQLLVDGARGKEMDSR